MSDKPAKKRMSVILTKVYVDALDYLVNEGIYMEYQTAIREALRLLFRLHGIAPFVEEDGLETEDVDQKGEAGVE